jgi:serine/threonine protein kinase
MKKWMLLAAISISCAAIISILKIDVTLDRQVIFIEGGEPVLADRVTQTDQFVYYEVDGKSGMFMNDDVTSVGSIQVPKKTSVLKIIDRKKQVIMAGFGASAQLIRVADSRLLIFLVVFALTCATMTMLQRMAVNARKTNRQEADDEASQLSANRASQFDQEGQETSDLREIAIFFLELFKLQKGLRKDAPARFSMAADSTSRKRKVFELGVKGQSDWLTRRMSVGPLGEDTGSKSKCFYVIYDTHMVVKIPPAPITDMIKYVGAIRREVQIAAHLSPITCIIPMVSVVLKKVKTLPYASSLTLEQLEKQYIRLVEENPAYQEYLKIGDRFAFFMELTNSFFLGRVINELHESKEKTGNEIREAPNVPWDQEAFTARYGLASLPIFEGLQTLYQLCENEAERIIRESGDGNRVHTFQIKNWFIAAIAGEALTLEGQSIDAALLAQIEDGFSTVIKSNQKFVDDLTLLLKSQQAKKAFLKSRQQIENMASNVLDLLCLLKEKRIALRDLKPDNLFLDANPDEYPMFLNNSEDFSIGVIDVETAISLIPEKDGTIRQPILGEHPFTPRHCIY